ncbi:MAG TPA: IS110 family transposase [Ktedonobacteraceae bacterium]|nr:IS110 family transposase [Ktedonobacteraceae bacterium]
MEVVYSRCSGFDVHKRFVVVCLSVIEQGQRHKELRQFSTMTNEILGLKEWLETCRCTHIAMESTGVYWKPIYHLLEDSFEIVLVNAQHMKNVPGRKTDVKDAEWIADLLQHGLLKASFIPSSQQQAVRDLTRTRMRLLQERTRLINRIHKVLEDANLKLASVVSDVMGVTGQAILRALVAGEVDPASLSHLARGRMPQERGPVASGLAREADGTSAYATRRTASVDRDLRSLDYPLRPRDRRPLALARSPHRTHRCGAGPHAPKYRSLVGRAGLGHEPLPRCRPCRFLDRHLSWQA